jgi:hypothetical protein
MLVGVPVTCRSASEHEIVAASSPVLSSIAATAPPLSFLYQQLAVRGSASGSAGTPCTPRGSDHCTHTSRDRSIQRLLITFVVRILRHLVGILLSLTLIDGSHFSVAKDGEGGVRDCKSQHAARVISATCVGSQLTT